MIIILKRNANKEKVENLKTELVNQGFKLHLSEGTEASLIGLIGDTSQIHEDWLKANDALRMSAGSVSRIRRQTAPCTQRTRSLMSAAERSAAETSGHRRSLLHRDKGTDHRGRFGRKAFRRSLPPRRCLQAENFPVRVPGSSRAGS